MAEPPTIEGLSPRGQRLLADFEFGRARRDRSSLVTRLAGAGLPAHPIAVALDHLMGGLRSPRDRRVGWLELGVLEELDDEGGYAIERIEGVDESECLGGTWPSPTYAGDVLVAVGGGCDKTFLASAGRLLVHDRMLDEVTLGPTSPLTFLEQGLLAMALSERRLDPSFQTWDWRGAPDVAAVAKALGATRIEEASHQAVGDAQIWWLAEGVFMVSDGIRHRAVAPTDVIAGARSRLED